MHATASAGITDAHEQLPCNFKLAALNYKRIAPAGGDASSPGAADADAQPPPPPPPAAAAERQFPIDPLGTVVKESAHTFCKRAKDWGFREFVAVEKLIDPRGGFCNGGSISIGVQIELD